MAPQQRGDPKAQQGTWAEGGSALEAKEGRVLLQPECTCVVSGPAAAGFGAGGSCLTVVVHYLVWRPGGRRGSWVVKFKFTFTSKFELHAFNVPVLAAAAAAAPESSGALDDPAAQLGLTTAARPVSASFAVPASAAATDAPESSGALDDPAAQLGPTTAARPDSASFDVPASAAATDAPESSGALDDPAAQLGPTTAAWSAVARVVDLTNVAEDVADDVAQESAFSRASAQIRGAARNSGMRWGHRKYQVTQSAYARSRKMPGHRM
eukprot:gene24940-10594_t